MMVVCCMCRRSFDPDAGPRGGDYPVITKDGNMILDIAFYEGLKLFGEKVPSSRIVEEIEAVPGVVAHGLRASKIASSFYFDGGRIHSTS